MRVLVLDLETIPDLVMGARVFGLDTAGPRAYEAMAGARLVETEFKNDFQKPALHRIVALGMVGITLDTGKMEVFAHAGPDEAEMVRTVHTWLVGQPVLVTWNGLGFDLPVLRYRALHHGVSSSRLFGAVGQKNWEKYDYRFGDQHYDLCDVFSLYGRSAALKLSEAAALFGFPCKTNTASADILTHWLAGEHERIRAHVEEDARVTARIFLRWWAARGRPGEFISLDAQLAQSAPAELALA
jgi:predicted PolB exonuclease-like 3'-5' exonuclease